MILTDTYSEAKQFLEDEDFVMWRKTHKLGIRIEQWTRDQTIAFVTVFPTRGGPGNARPTVIAIREKG